MGVVLHTGHKIVNYSGNLVGDVMWTVQPIVQLNGTAVLRYIESMPSTPANVSVPTAQDGVEKKRRSRKDKEL
jgi:hypothetical protein